MNAFAAHWRLQGNPPATLSPVLHHPSARGTLLQPPEVHGPAVVVTMMREVFHGPFLPWQALELVRLNCEVCCGLFVQRARHVCDRSKRKSTARSNNYPMGLVLSIVRDRLHYRNLSSNQPAVYPRSCSGLFQRLTPTSALVKQDSRTQPPIAAFSALDILYPASLNHASSKDMIFTLH